MKDNTLPYGRTSRLRFPGSKRARLAVTLVVMILYVSGYIRMRMVHNFVHNATGYTGDNGNWVRTDNVGLGDRRGSGTYSGLCDEVLYMAYWPLRELEGIIWPMMPGNAGRKKS